MRLQKSIASAVTQPDIERRAIDPQRSAARSAGHN